MAAVLRNLASCPVGDGVFTSPVGPEGRNLGRSVDIILTQIRLNMRIFF